MRVPIDPRRVAASLLPANGVGVEIGVHLGEFSRLILMLARPAKLTLIDPWQHRQEPVYAGSLYGGSVGQEVLDRRYLKVMRDFKSRIDNGSVEVVRDLSANAVGKFADQSLNFVYIDGDHTFEGVAEDIRLYWPKLKSGGLMVGDDYRLGGYWEDGVVRAFRNLISQPDALVEFKVGSQIAVRKY